MNELEIVINPYNCTTRININNRPISPYSEISNYLKEPFYTWCDKILDTISRELNDEFNITIISRKSEFNLLRGMANNFEECMDIKYKNFSIDISLVNRLKNLLNISNKCKINIGYNKFLINLFTFDICKDDIVNFSYDSPNIQLEKDECIFKCAEYPLCDIRLNIEEYSIEKFKQKVQDINFIITSSNEKAEKIYNEIKRYNVPICILICNDNFGVEKLNNIFIYECKDINFLSCLFEFLEFRWITPFYNKIVNDIESRVIVDKLDLLEELKLLSSIDPFVTVHCVEQMEVNTFAPLIIKSYPDNADIPKLNFKFNKENIISCDGKNILALAVGSVEVEVYIQGSLEPISKFNINVTQRNKIKSIELNNESYTMGIQDILKLSYKFYPENADNQAELYWTTTDNTVASVDESGNIIALNPGTCYIKISTEDVSASCLVNVKQKIKNIILSEEDINLYIGETTRLNLEIFPLDVINSDIICETSDKNVAVFENGVIRATGIGNASINFYTADKSVSNSCQIKVKSTFEKKEYKNTPLIASIIVFILSIILSSISIFNIIIPIIGCILGFLAIKHNRNDSGTATLFIILNIIMFMIIFLQ